MAVLVDYALTNVADVKESLGLASGDHTKDNLIIRKINSVSDMIQSYCQRNFMLQEYVEEYKASHIDEVVLKQRPIVIDNQHTFLAEWRTTSFNDNVWESIDDQLYFIDQDSGVLELMYIAQGHWRRYRYTYWAGYVTIPNDLAEAANVLTCWFVNNPAGLTAYIAGRTEGQRQTRYVLHANKSFQLLMAELGIDDTVNNYADETVLTDR